MASSSRRQIETWLGSLEIKGKVADIGGLFWPVKGRTKRWLVTRYDIFDVVSSRKGVYSSYLWDFNKEKTDWTEVGEYDVAFCVEVTDHLWDPVTAFKNIRRLMKTGGELYVSSNFLFPHHTGFDCLRLTSTGLQKIMKETGFEVLSIQPRFAVDGMLVESMRKESKVVNHQGEIGYMCIAKAV